MNLPKEDRLIVGFDNAMNDEGGICVMRQDGENIKIVKMELGEQAEILYRLLTEQMTKAEIKAESEVEPNETDN